MERRAMHDVGIDVAFRVTRHAQCDAAIGGGDKGVRNEIVEHTRRPALYERLASEELAGSCAARPLVAPTGSDGSGSRRDRRAR